MIHNHFSKMLLLLYAWQCESDDLLSRRKYLNNFNAIQLFMFLRGWIHIIGNSGNPPMFHEIWFQIWSWISQQMSDWLAQHFVQSFIVPRGCIRMTFLIPDFSFSTTTKFNWAWVKICWQLLTGWLLNLLKFFKVPRGYVALLMWWWSHQVKF